MLLVKAGEGISPELGGKRVVLKCASRVSTCQFVNIVQTKHYVAVLQPTLNTFKRSKLLCLGKCAFCVDMDFSVLKLHQHAPVRGAIQKSFPG
jgi:hypothetical protein